MSGAHAALKERRATIALERQAKVAELLAAKWPIWKIAGHLGISQPTIAADRKVLLEGAQAEVLKSRDEWIAGEVADAYHHIAELEAEWVRSKEDRKKHRQETSAGGDTKLIDETEGRLADVRYKAEIRAWKDFLAKLLGHYAAPKAAQDKDGNAVPVTVNMTIVGVDGKD